MAIWELALLIISFTVLVVNVFNILLTLAVVGKFSDIFDRSLKLANKLMDKSEKAIDEMFDEDEE